MLAGAYSKTYQYIEQQRLEQLKHVNEEQTGDAVARAKKLSVETNRRRKAQASKRKLEQQREEKRRQHILTKRREQQREATEKYQRSHVPPRPPSGRPTSHRSTFSSTRTLDETLRLVRGNSGVSRQNSTGSNNSASSRQNYSDALNRPYFNKYSNFHQPVIQNDRVRESSSRDKLHNKSLRNLSNSKSLFEQRLEQQQQKLVNEQKKAFNEFNDTLMKELNSDQTNGRSSPTDSSCSADSLDVHDDSLQENHANFQTPNDFKRNEMVLNTKSSIKDTHQSARDISFQLNNSYGQNLPYADNGEQIDSYNVDQTLNDKSPHNANSSASEEKQVYQNENVLTKGRPKVHLRAWSTPSPVDSQHTGTPITTGAQITKSNPYTPRATMTTVTTTTAYNDRNSSVHQQGNGRIIEQNRPTVQRNDVMVNGQNKNEMDNSSSGQNRSEGDKVSHNAHFGYTKGDDCRYMGSGKSVMNGNNIQQSGQKDINNGPVRNMEFLESVTKTMDNADSKTQPPSGQTQKPISRVPRPVSAVRIQKVQQYNVIQPPSSNYNTAGEVINEDIRNGATDTSKPSQVFYNTMTERQQPKQVTQVKFAASVVNGSVNMANYGKLNVQTLPNRPVIAGVTSKTETNNNNTQKKARDDIDLECERREHSVDNGNEVRGILKRPGGSARQLRKVGSTGSVNSMEVKDSIEVARIHMQQQAKEIPKKKSVRFADLNYPSDASDEESEQVSSNSETNGHPKPSRPVSAKVVSHTSKTNSQIPRAMSAGSRPQIKHKSTIRPQAAAHIITHSSEASSILNAQSRGDKKISTVPNNFMSKVPTSLTPAYTEATVYSVPGVRMNYTSSTVANVPKQEQINYVGKENNGSHIAGDMPSYHLNQAGPVFDENGMRIDRTPTDDEINFLWEKVRTCLSRPTGPQSSENQKMPQPSEPQRQQQVSNQYIDGAALNKIGGANRSQQVLYVQQNGTKTNNKPSEQSYQRRFGLLQQRKQQNPNSLNKGSQPTYNGPVYSHNEPSVNGPGYQASQDVSGSMAAFLTAEHLAQHSMSDSQIQIAMDDAQRTQQFSNAVNPQQKVPSALSIEEQRLLESLDRLNEKLKITEFPGNLLQDTQQTVIQHPDPQQYVYQLEANSTDNGGAFKGHQPLNSQRRLGEGTRGGFRGGARQQIYRYA